ncbi:molybdopterin-dependent oxidoreductase [Klebsiella pneumoniae]|uniref:molybdopterin-dependent oxidoreductase n=1 Tax=Klebsiella pneumoniae TaxID=573 RepID=UPI0025A203E5|nr:molybdopterin-dependent oxidoreductase [Klebsiella pneumoniae]MDM7159725.1 molybdopterin-dependent oxidoreductase [Klebsiella pneumoniae]
MHKFQLSFFATILFVTSQTMAATEDINIDGMISHKNNDIGYTLTFNDFIKMPMAQIKTTTPWTKPKTKVDFEGVRVKDILKLVGAQGRTLRMIALNDYSIDIPVSDVENYNIIFAYKMNGKKLKVRNFGPYFVIYPLDEHASEINNPLYLSRFIWQVNKITVLK